MTAPVARRGRVAAILALALAVLLGACSGLDGGVETSPLPSPGSATGEPGAGSDPTSVASARAMSRFYEQELDWAACEEHECATLEVPLDYGRPRRESILIDVLRVPARDQDRRLGALVVNPGGPGGSGTGFAASAASRFGPDVLEVFDIVGFDPRGVGASARLSCADTAALDRYNAADPTPDSAAERRLGLRLVRQLGRGCLSRSGDLPRHMSTQEVVRDLDVLRAALGQETLAYFGASYGTYIGSAYADRFPERVGRLVLDGAIDPTLSSLELSRGQAQGFQTAFEAYVAHCLESECRLGDTLEEAERTVSNLLAGLDDEPITVGDRQLTEGLAVYGILFPLYQRDYWIALDVALPAAIDGDGRPLLMLADAGLRRDSDGYAANTVEVLPAVNCVDHPDAVPPRRVPELQAGFEEVSPTFGRFFAAGLPSCSAWPVRSTLGPERRTAEGAAPILVVGTTRDPATPLAWAEGLAAQLDSGVLLRRDGDGHTGYHAGNGCVDRVVEAYLLRGELPPDPTDC